MYAEWTKPLLSNYNALKYEYDVILIFSSSRSLKLTDARVAVEVFLLHI